ncbi:phytoene desaturase [Histidinibacterium aquaticum]|uniref:Phytoene dehydrogenase n=1 Tax=Histidinibacterium aquaticum TaxID=2613962 RepID=A0A5J5GGE9_9RHOB|nr:phytoene desaturase [Histidinibacterium aquaticum]KAA9006842.1 phytoene desaturase [Histidinibacterium aquaticum]
MLTASGDNRAVVIGAGLGGLASAMRLGAKGYAVTVVDRLDRAGGRGSSITMEGHRFDLGPTIVTMPELFSDLWAACGRDFRSDVDLRPLDTFYEIRWPDGSSFKACADTDRMVEEVRRLSPGDVNGYLRFLKGSEARYRIGFERLGRMPMHKLSQTIRVLPDFARLRADRSILSLAKSLVKDDRLRMALSFHPLFIGGDPSNVTSMYALVGHLEKTFGVHYAIGGVQAIADAMATVVRDQGGTIRLGAEADEILLDQGRARGVRMKTGETLSAPLIVSNADAGHTYAHLLRKSPRTRWTDRRLNRASWSMGLFVWYFGTRGTRQMWRDVGHHTIINGPRYAELLKDIFGRGHLAPDMSLYLHRPSVTDPGVAPEGDDTFYALSPVPHLGWEDPVDWSERRESYRQAVAQVLEAHIPGFQAHLGPSHILTPEDFRTRYLSPNGSGFSIEPRILQSAWFRPHNVSEEAKGLYLAGAGTHPGAGLPGVIASAEVLDSLVPPAPAADVRLAAE